MPGGPKKSTKRRGQSPRDGGAQRPLSRLEAMAMWSSYQAQQRRAVKKAREAAAEKKREAEKPKRKTVFHVEKPTENTKKSQGDGKGHRPGRGGLGGGLALIGLGVAVFALVGVWRAMDVGDRLTGFAHAQVAKAGLVPEYVEVRGARLLDPDSVIRQLQVQPGHAMSALDVVGAQDRLVASPWVRDVAVMRLYPNRVIVIINERKPIALWQGDDGAPMALVDEEGAVIDGVDPAQLDPAVIARLPVVRGQGAPAAAPDLIASLAERPDVRARVREARWVGDRRWDVMLTTGAVVNLPEGSPARAISLLEQLNARNGILDLALARIDVRHGLVVAVDPRAGGLSGSLSGAGSGSFSGAGSLSSDFSAGDFSGG